MVVYGMAAVPAPAAPDVDKHGATPGRWTQDYDAAAALAKNQNLPLFLNFTGSDWCPWCHFMDEKVFLTPEWADFSPALALAFLDSPRDIQLPEKVLRKNAELRNKYEIKGFPSYILLAPDGQELARLGAYKEITAERFIQMVRNAIPEDLKPKPRPPSPGHLVAPGRPAAPAANPYAPRTWTSAAGTAITATYVSYDGRAVTLRLPDGSLSRIAPANLSEADQQFLAPLIGHRP